MIKNARGQYEEVGIVSWGKSIFISTLFANADYSKITLDYSCQERTYIQEKVKKQRLYIPMCNVSLSQYYLHTCFMHHEIH